MNPHSSHGSIWNRWDLHFHTPSSFDYLDRVTDQQIVDGLVTNGVRVVAITDHHVMDVARIRRLQQLAADKLTVLPGVELRSDQGGEPIHYICVFPEDCDLDHVWTTLQGKLELTPTAIQQKGGDERVYVPIEQWDTSPGVKSRCDPDGLHYKRRRSKKDKNGKVSTIAGTEPIITKIWILERSLWIFITFINTQTKDVGESTSKISNAR